MLRSILLYVASGIILNSMLDNLKNENKYYIETKGFKVKGEAYLESSRTCITEPICENS